MKDVTRHPAMIYHLAPHAGCIHRRRAGSSGYMPSRLRTVPNRSSVFRSAPPERERTPDLFANCFSVSDSYDRFPKELMQAPSSFVRT